MRVTAGCGYGARQRGSIWRVRERHVGPVRRNSSVAVLESAFDPKGLRIAWTRRCFRPVGALTLTRSQPARQLRRVAGKSSLGQEARGELLECQGARSTGFLAA